MAIQKITSGIIQDGAIAAADIVSVSNTAITGNITSSQIAPDQTLNGNVSVTGTLSTPNTFGFKNRIINGGMAIDQRNAGASVTITNTSVATYTLDRWQVYGSAASKFSVQQNAAAVTPPAGFKNYLGVTSLAATSLAAGDQYYVGQYIEGYNVADMGFGAAGASTFTISFWVRSSLTGTFGGSVANSAFNRSYPFTYTISSANTWEQKSITIVGDTSGTWLSTNGIGLQVNFGIGVGTILSGTANAWAGAAYVSATGATSVVGTSGATFYITGVQLEKGSTATSFDFRDYGRELAMCQRYFQVGGEGFTGIGNGTQIATNAFFPVTMRTAPSIAATAALRFTDWTTAAYTQSSASVTSYSASTFGMSFNSNNFTSVPSNRPLTMTVTTGSAGSVQFSAEL